MPWLIALVLAIVFLHFLWPLLLAVIVAAVLMSALWLMWKLKWVILAIFGLEEIFGDR
jgi:hypothetical protein